MQTRPSRWLAAIAVAAAVFGCVGTPGPGGDQPRSSALPAPPDPADNPTTPAKAALGKKLFFDPRLSGDGSMACQGCHYRHLGWTDGLALSRKVGGGMNTRHTPSVYNTGYYTSWYCAIRRASTTPATTPPGTGMGAPRHWRGRSRRPGRRRSVPIRPRRQR
ncbi:MAG: Cytochrome c551 peroxidase precursor [Candidatus Accumulibacter adjunctus]|uniref:Cytochrome c551 peroxidase n=1 Tax=Candidatus Accumulibacter adjunctus TaxID=1454001 RepID=A0A011MDE2_9PROT|nr:MAG: Cytochrome c551 peroxidase precursor [Candidatus Accumulibacter adjunctus]